MARHRREVGAVAGSAQKRSVAPWSGRPGVWGKKLPNLVTEATDLPTLRARVGPIIPDGPRQLGDLIDEGQDLRISITISVSHRSPPDQAGAAAGREPSGSGQGAAPARFAPPA